MASMKMIIITSNEDIIRQFSLNNYMNTYTIDLTNDNQCHTNENNASNIINLDFVTQLYRLNSNNDQLYKRALDSSDHFPPGPVKTQKKSNDFMCIICGDHAVGYNYNVLSCASCKIFFRRNYHLDLEKLKCAEGHSQCSIAYKTRRKCQKCRLRRCFDMGMKKESILSEEEKERKRKQYFKEDQNTPLEFSSNSDSVSPGSEEYNHTSIDDNNIVLDESIKSNQINNILSVEDLSIIENIRSSFVSYFGGETVQCSCVDVTDRISALITWSQLVNRVTLRFINFFRQINEFENLHPDDRFILIKYNTFAIFLMSKCFYYNPINDCCSRGNNIEAIKHRQFFMICGAPSSIRETFVDLVISLVETTKQDPILLSLLSIILLLSRGLSINESEPLLQDSLAVHRAQAQYTRILWNYLVNQTDEKEACKRFTQLLTIIFQIQSVAKRILEFFRVQYMTSDRMDRMAPLIQSVLHIY